MPIDGFWRELLSDFYLADTVCLRPKRRLRENTRTVGQPVQEEGNDEPLVIP
jgi:hypothetical protein